MAIERAKLKDLKATVKTQTRAELNPETLADYKEHCKLAKSKGANPSFPPLRGCRNPLETDIYLYDGFTRRAALIATGFEDYEIDIVDSEDPKRDAVKLGFKANIEHGARLTNEDKKHNLLLALEDAEWKDFSNNALADLVGVSEGFVRQHRPAAAAPQKRKTKAGKDVDTSNIGKKTGSARKKAAAAKKAAKGAAPEGEPGNEPETGKGGKAPEAPAPKEDAEFIKALAKIGKAVDGHGFIGEKVIEAIKTGALPLSAKEVKAFAATSDERIRHAAPLVINLRWSVAKAYKFLDTEPTGDTKAEHFVNLAVAHGGIVTERVDNAKCVWFLADDYTVGESPEGVITITPKAKGKKKK